MKKISKHDLKNIRIVLKNDDDGQIERTDEENGSGDGRFGIALGLFACAAAVGYLAYVIYKKYVNKRSAQISGDDDFDDCSVKDGSCDISFENPEAGNAESENTAGEEVADGKAAE